MIIEELEVVEETNPDNEGKITISSRQGMIDKIGRSPDFWSSFLMRAFFEIKPAIQYRSYATSL